MEGFAPIGSPECWNTAKIIAVKTQALKSDLRFHAVASIPRCLTFDVDQFGQYLIAGGDHP